MPPKPLPPKPWPRLTDEARAPDLVRCQLCGGGDLPLTVFEQCDEDDQPEGRLLTACSRRECSRRIKDHPRLYRDVDVRPGAIAALCVDCVHRDGLRCRHPDLRANGGAGLVLTLSSLMGAGVVVCVKGRGCGPLPRRATACKGQQHLAVVRDEP